MRQEGNIYFDTSKLKEYYVFGNNMNSEDLVVGARDDVTEDSNKKIRRILCSGLPNQNLMHRN